MSNLYTDSGLGAKIMSRLLVEFHQWQNNDLDLFKVGFNNWICDQNPRIKFGDVYTVEYSDVDPHRPGGREMEVKEVMYFDNEEDMTMFILKWS